jgi:hypothetical protein
MSTASASAGSANVESTRVDRATSASSGISTAVGWPFVGVVRALDPPLRCADRVLHVLRYRAPIDIPVRVGQSLGELGRVETVQHPGQKRGGIGAERGSQGERRPRRGHRRQREREPDDEEYTDGQGAEDREPGTLAPELPVDDACVAVCRVLRHEKRDGEPERQDRRDNPRDGEQSIVFNQVWKRLDDDEPRCDAHERERHDARHEPFGRSGATSNAGDPSGYCATYTYST